MDYNLPVGFRFHPTEEELIHYLNRKLEGDDTSVINNIIPEINLCNVEPWDIPARMVIKTNDTEWFFFSPVDYKNAGSKRMNRETERGYWKGSGSDHVIKETGTNNVIGTRKILRFYEGRRGKNDSMTNWAMHEYHAAATSDDSHQRNFVLCHLMKKAEKKTQWGTGAIDKGGPSRHMDSDCKNKAAEEGIPNVHGLLPEVNTDSIVRTWHQEQSYNANSRNENSSRQTSFVYTEGIKDVFGSFPEMDVDSILQIMDQTIYPSIRQSRIIFDEVVSLPALPSHNANLRNENSSRQAPVEITKEDDEYWNSKFPDGKFVFTEKRRNAFVKGSQPESLRMVYYESSDTDAEVVSAVCFNIVDTSTVRDEHPSSGEYHASKMYKSSHGVKASSCDSTADKALNINCIRNSGSVSPRRWKYQYHTKPFISQRAAVRYQYQPQRKLSGNAVSDLEVRKPSSCTRKMKKPDKDHVIARNSSSRKNSETRNHQCSNINRESSFICQETASSSQSLFPLLADIVLGILLCMLFIVISLELLSSY